MRLIYLDKSKQYSEQVWQHLAGNDINEQKKAGDVCESYLKVSVRF